MAIKSSGPLYLYNDIGRYFGLGASNVSLRNVSSRAGKGTPDAMSEFYGYSGGTPPTPPPVFPPTATAPPTTNPPTRPPASSPVATAPPTRPPTGGTNPPTRPPTGTNPPTRPPAPVTNPPTRPPTRPPATNPPTRPPTRPPIATNPPTRPPISTRPPTAPPVATSCSSAGTLFGPFGTPTCSVSNSIRANESGGRLFLNRRCTVIIPDGWYYEDFGTSTFEVINGFPTGNSLLC